MYARNRRALPIVVRAPDDRYGCESARQISGRETLVMKREVTAAIGLRRAQSKSAENPWPREFNAYDLNVMEFHLEKLWHPRLIFANLKGLKKESREASKTPRFPSRKSEGLKNYRETDGISEDPRPSRILINFRENDRVRIFSGESLFMPRKLCIRLSLLIRLCLVTTTFPYA
jgi:hypothetical protein